MSIPQIESITTLARDFKAVLAKLPNGPVFITQRSDATAVVLSVGDYERLIKAEQQMKRLLVLEGLLEAKANAAKADADPASVVSLAEVKQRIAAKAGAHVGN
jgi:prevent-host-death family protein